MSRGLVHLVYLVTAAIASCSSAQEAKKDDPAALVLQLPTNQQAGIWPSKEKELVEQVAALGEQALPALEKELRLGIRFRELNQILGTGGSRRWCVVQVLARIPGDRSTDLLVRSLSDTPDNYAMRMATLTALEQRNLADAQVLAMLSNLEPQVALAGLAHAAKRMGTPAIKAGIERIFDPNAAVAQFRNEYGASTANPDGLWEVRLAAGRALSRDVVPEMRARATQLLAGLKREALHPTEPDKPVQISYASAAEIAICGGLGKLEALGQPVKDLVESEAKVATGDHAAVLDMALARLGDRGRVPQIAKCLTDSPSHTLRFCAAVTLRKLRDPSAIPAFRKALRDPYHRQDGSCVRTGDGEIYPVRIVAADALIELGEDPKQVRETMRRKE